MEELQAQLKGNDKAVIAPSLSLDSLEHASVKESNSWTSLRDLSPGEDSVFGTEQSGDIALSVTQSDKVLYQENIQDDDNIIEDNSFNAIHDSEHEPPASFYLLPPIEEKSEPSTSGSSKSDNYDASKRHISTSLHNISTSRDNRMDDESPRSQTFPRSRASASESQRCGPRHNFSQNNTLYPLEPRELDPESFQQLHTADSQEELQEFLLLESQCTTTDNNAGIAAAFINSDEGSGKGVILTIIISLQESVIKL